jgi:hypothetical protein
MTIYKWLESRIGEQVKITMISLNYWYGGSGIDAFKAKLLDVDCSGVAFEDEGEMFVPWHRILSITKQKEAAENDD